MYKFLKFLRGTGLLDFEDSLGGSNTDVAQKLGFVVISKDKYEIDEDRDATMPED